MHLVIVNQYGLPAGASGITRHGDLGAALVRQGHDVTVIASRFNYLTRDASGSRRTSRSVHDGVRFVWLDTGSYRANDGQRIRSMLAYSLRATWTALRLDHRPDVVMGSSPHLLAGLVGALVARRFGVPYLFEVRDLWPSALVDLGAVRAGGLVHRALELVERVCYRVADRIVIVPPHAHRRVGEMGTDPGRCVHIPNASAGPTDGPVEPLPASLEAILASFEGRQIVMYAGAQGVSNGLDLVLEAMDLLRDEEPATYASLAVVLIGDGGRHDALVAAAAARGHAHLAFHPPIAKAAIPAALARASALLVSFADAAVYAYGLSPNKLFDYLAAGRPVLLASRLPDTPVAEADAGRTYDPGSARSLAAALADLLACSPEERAAMGRRGQALVRERYSIDVTGRQLGDLLRTVAPGAT
ncbi:MAG: glycosyltransferase family 4 protein [Candidatus Limnocylindria bacterium]